MRREVLICLLLAGITLGLYWPVGRMGFIDYDDPAYILSNPPVREGISPENIWWAFTTPHASNWHPVTWLSLALDCQLFGPNPAVFHWENVAWHTANALLLFLLLRKMTRSLWRSAFVAALFAWHPAHLQSVVWISERKDVLSGFFLLLTLLAYAEYVKREERRAESGAGGANGKHPTSILLRRAYGGQAIQHPTSIGGQEPTSALRPIFPLQSSIFYFLSLTCFALGLMSKPMLVTLPVILLLLDFWPLGRFTICDLRCPMSNLLSPISYLLSPASGLRPLLLEKLPFAGLSLLSILATFWAQGTGHDIVNIQQLPLLERLANVPVFVTEYLEKLFWPADLTIYYPYQHIPVWEQGGCFLLVALLTVFCLWRLRFNPPVLRSSATAEGGQPFFLTGWLWFLVMLLPVIGLVKAGTQSIADRYTYLPSIGLFIAVVWGWAALAGRPAPVAGSAGVPPAGSGTVPVPVPRTGGETPPEPAAGTAALPLRQVHGPNARPEAVAAAPVAGSSRREEAPIEIEIGEVRASSRRLLPGEEPSNARRSEPAASSPPQRRWAALAALGAACLLACLVDTRYQMKYWRNAATLNQHSLDVTPENNAVSHVGVGCALWRETGDLDGAARHFELALQANSNGTWLIDNAVIHHKLGVVRLSQDNPAEAAAQFAAALTGTTNQAESAIYHKYLGDALAGEGKTVAAEAEYTRAEQLLPGDAGLGQQIAASRTLAQLRETAKTGPTPEIYVQLAGSEANQGLARDALEHYLAALKLSPEAPEILNNLAWLLATSLDNKVRDGNRAIQYARRACELTQYGNIVLMGTLAAAYAEAGKFDDAIATAQKACDLAAKAGDAGLLQQNQELLKAYRAHQTALGVKG